jgi:hypothetical protein
MTLSRRVASLLTSLLLLAAGGHAQTPLGQPTLEERKVQIWCATAKFVYEDTGHPELKSQLKCGGPLKDFAGSIKADEQRVYSALYQPLEVQGVMYKGLGSDNSRLQTLVREIINRLRTSPSRKGNAARLAGVTKLETALKNYLDQGTPIGDLPAAEATAETETVDTTATTDEATAAAPGDAGLDEAGVATPTPAAAGTGEGLMNKFFGPLALILALLSLVLYALLKRSIGASWKEINARIDKRRDDIAALQSSPGSGAGAGKPAERFSPAQLRELEQLIQQRVEQELQKRQATPKANVAPATPAPAPQPVAPAPQPVAPVPAPVAPPVPAAAPAPAPVPPTVAPAAPASSPAAPQEEFDSLIPPVQLPTAPAAAPAVSTADQPRTRYVKVPVNGVFNEYDFSDEPQHDSIYEIHLDPQWPELATFSVTQNPAVHAYAIQSAQYSLREACKYQQPAGPVTRIVTEEEGVLRKAAGAWQIEQKAAIRFE